MSEGFALSPEDKENGESVMEKIARDNFARWNETLLSLDAHQVAELYSTEATFLPTVSGEFKKDQTGAEGYFKHFLEKNPSGEIIEEAVQALGENCYLHSGHYNFEVGPVDKRETVEARFSFVWVKNDQGEWKIAHHHSSQRPK